MNTRASIALLVLSSGVVHAQVAIIERDFGQPTGNVVVLRSGARPGSLQGIQLLPSDVVGRTRLQELLPGTTRREEIPGATRLILPEERGSLYKYRRVAATGGATFGYFLVDPAGEARTLFELSGTGALGSDDPLPGRVAVDSSGKTALLASSLDAGGDLWELDLVTGRVTNRTPDVAPRSFKRAGLALLGGFGIAVADDGVYRFPRVNGGRAREVSMPSAVVMYGPDVVTSADGTSAAFLAGDSINRALVFTCRASGDALQASATPMRIPNAGFLPESATGPHLALSSDGSWVAWRREGSSSELFVRETRPGPRPGDLQVTGDAHFDDTLNDTGVIAFFGTNSLFAVVGKEDDDGIDKADAFRIDLAPGSLTASNLSRTSGIVRPPFDYGTLDTSNGLYQVGASQPAFFAHDDDGGGRLIRFGTSGDVQVVLGLVDSLDCLRIAGDHLVAEVTRPPGVDHPLAESLNLVQVPLGAPGALVLPLPTGTRVSRESTLASGGVFGGVLELQTGGEWLGRMAVPNAAGSILGTTPRNFGPTTALTPDGILYASVLSGTRQLFLSWSGIGVQLLRNSPGGSFVLPSL